MGIEKKKKNGEPLRYNWECRRRMVNPRDIAGKEEEGGTHSSVLGEEGGDIAEKEEEGGTHSGVLGGEGG